MTTPARNATTSSSPLIGRQRVDGADVPGGGNRESVWIGPARRHAQRCGRRRAFLFAPGCYACGTIRVPTRTGPRTWIGGRAAGQLEASFGRAAVLQREIESQGAPPRPEDPGCRQGPRRPHAGGRDAPPTRRRAPRIPCRRTSCASRPPTSRRRAMASGTATPFSAAGRRPSERSSHGRPRPWGLGQAGIPSRRAGRLRRLRRLRRAAPGLPRGRHPRPGGAQPRGR